MLTAFGIDDRLEGFIKDSSNYQSNTYQDGNYIENISDVRPGVAWIAGGDQFPQPGFAEFQITNSNKWLDFSPTSATSYTSISVPIGFYNGSTLASEITYAMQALSVDLQYWECTYNPVDGKFRLGDASGGLSPDYIFRAETGPNAGSGMGPTLGFNKLDTPDAIEHFSDHGTFGNHTWVLFDTNTAKITTFLCDVDTETSNPDEEVDSSDIRMYGSATNLGGGSSLQNWISSASKTLVFSAKPSKDENQIRIAFDSGGASMAYRYWLFSWVHNDSTRRHKVKLVKGFDMVGSSTRTINTMTGHGLDTRATPIGMSNYYPVSKLKNWRIPLAFDAWGATDYRNVIHAVVRHGRQKCVLWMLRWDDVKSGAVTTVGDVEFGYIVWCSLREYSLDSYVGQSADYISGELSLEQLR